MQLDNDAAELGQDQEWLGQIVGVGMFSSFNQITSSICTHSHYSNQNAEDIDILKHRHQESTNDDDEDDCFDDYFSNW